MVSIVLPSEPNLTQEDYAHLEASWITPELARQARVRRVESFEGAEIVGRKDGSAGRGKYSGLVFPNFAPGAPEPRSYRLKLDNPEFEVRDGKQRPKRKYLAAYGSSNQLYTVPGTDPDWLRDTELPVVITEGEKKTLALYRLAYHERDEPDFLALGVTGVWNWCGTVGKGTGPNGERISIKGAIADLGLIEWKDRPVSIAFDTDWRTNESVAAARKMLARELAKRGAQVTFADIPEDAGVKAIDDLLVAWGPERVRELFANPTPAFAALRRPTNFAEKDGGLVRFKTGRDQSIEEIPLANFTAQITADIVEDDGAETRRFFGIEAAIGGARHNVVIPVETFAAMDWPIRHLGPHAIVQPNQKDFARAAIQSLSTDIQQQSIFIHTGWRKVRDAWAYLHGDGAIGQHGTVAGVDVRLSGALAGYRLCLPKDPATQKHCIQSSLAILELGPPHITFPLVSAVCRSVLKAADFALWFAGPTGVFKSEIAALGQQHFGAEMNARKLPGNFASTANAIESIAFLAKDTLIVVDDFAPHGGMQDVARYHATADRIIRAAGNSQGRGRLTSDAKLREAKPPRGLILVTGEDAPRGQSIRGRALIVEIGPGDIRKDRLTECQQAAANGDFVGALGGFVKSLAGHREEALAQLQRRTVELRAEATKAHSRTPGIVAELQAGFEIFAAFAVVAGAISEEAAELTGRCWTALNYAARSQRDFQVASDPALRYLDLLRSAIQSGEAHVVSPIGAMPANADSWGWREEGTGENVRWVCKGKCIGWLDGEQLYIDPVAAYAAAQELGRKTGEPLAVSERAINKRLHEQGLLASTETARETLTLRRSLQGTQRKVLHMTVASFRSIVGFEGPNVSSLSGGNGRPDITFGSGISKLQRNVGNVRSFQGEERVPEQRSLISPEGAVMEVTEL